MSDKNRVVMLSSNFYPGFVGGAEKQALELSKALSRQGAGCLVLTRRLRGLPRSAKVEGIPVERLSSRLFLPAVFFWLLKHRGEYGVVHVHLAGSPAVPAALAARLLGKPCVIKLGGGMGLPAALSTSQKTFWGRLKLLLLRLAAPRFATVNSELVAELAANGFDGADYAVIPNGVDTRRYRPPSPDERAEARRKIDVKEGLVLLYTGRFAREKQLDRFLQAFADALKAKPAAALLILLGAGEEEETLKAQAKALGLETRVRFLPPADEVLPFYWAADALVLPSLSEGLSNSLLEAMACGLPAVASRVGGTREAVLEGRSGLLFDPQDYSAMRRQIETLLAKPALAAELGGHAREDAGRYDIERTAKSYLEFYARS